MNRLKNQAINKPLMYKSDYSIQQISLKLFRAIKDKNCCYELLGMASLVILNGSFDKNVDIHFVGCFFGMFTNVLINSRKGP